MYKDANVGETGERKPFVTCEERDGIALVTLNSPDTRNAMSSDADFSDIETTFGRIHQNREIRAAILTGSGKAFSAGGDVKLMHERASDSSIQPHEDRYRYQEGIHRVTMALHRFEVPLIAAVNGPAIGAGLDLACMCDIRIASDRATFAESFVKVGIIPGDGGAWLLQRVIGPARAAEMTFTGDTINAETALQYGLISKIVPHDRLLDEAFALAARIAVNPSHVLRMSKRLMRESTNARLETVLEMSAAFQALAHASEDHRERVANIVARLG
ncbi:crotonase/enoyl-CoA hydratase family protein [Paraburkholderia caribensis]|uniref:crotonase/enoyl-CoA hydratase family protein n=1 Tax=Paraburkholderia caribensis TaxID=75105 RepID=UPI001590855C|nr:crotonase/enoyl-CoA hydratase family protein [Paraburkholderia caribensis]